MEFTPEVRACPPAPRHVTLQASGQQGPGPCDSPLDPTPCTVPGTQEALKKPSFDEEITLLHH